MAFLRTIDNLHVEGTLVLKEASGNYTIDWADPAADRALNVIDPGGTDSFLFAAATQTITNKSINASQINSGTLGITVGIAQGGTGATTAQAAINALAGLTTKGDILVYNGTNAVRLAVGTNGQVLKADSGTATGLIWATDSDATLTTKGDILGHDGSTNVRVPVGTNNKILTADSTAASGLAYKFGALIGSATLTSATTLTSTSVQKNLVDATTAAFTVTLPAASAVADMIFAFKKFDSTNNQITIARAGSDTIDGATSFVLKKQWDAIMVYSNGTNWFVI